MANELDFRLLTVFVASRETEIYALHSVLAQHILKLHSHIGFKISAPLGLVFGEETNFKLIWTLLFFNHKLEELVILGVELSIVSAIINWLHVVFIVLFSVNISPLHKGGLVLVEEDQREAFCLRKRFVAFEFGDFVETLKRSFLLA
jgi:hypothetical protein